MAPRKKILVVFSSLCFCSTVQAGEPEGTNQLIDIYYRFEVAAVYCGLAEDEAIKGYYVERRQVVEKFNLDEADQLYASGQASQLAHKEWMNRGLGGFKPWCRNEGRGYADHFLKLNSSEGSQ